MRKRVMLLLLVVMSALIVVSPVAAKHSTNPQPGSAAPWSGNKGGGK